ncbi:hypothetical protein PDR5_14350 [Pseudomonas sp. DR 5-09]|nr:hypothetical protein PDR5_14350 [Pseudomonas sp. DR 5-09]
MKLAAYLRMIQLWFSRGQRKRRIEFLDSAPDFLICRPARLPA